MPTIGVLSDTHIPDRAKALKPWIIPLFRLHKVDAILHGGDVCIPEVIMELEKVAPVYAVRGNRDIWRLRHLPRTQTLKVGDVKIGLAHGHGHWWNYLLDKVYTLSFGLNTDRNLHYVVRDFPDAQIVVYGHTHMPVNQWVEGKLCFNPGAACCWFKKAPFPTVGIIHILPGGEIKGQLYGFKEDQPVPACISS